MKITLTALSSIIILMYTSATAATHHIWPSHDFDTRMTNVLNSVQNFDTVHIHGNHTYTTDVGQYVINKDITIKGDGLGTTRIKRSGSSSQTMFQVNANGVTFENITLYCNYKAKQAIKADGVRGLSLVNVALDGGNQGPTDSSTGLNYRNAQLSAIHCTESKSLPDLRLKNSTFKNFGWAALYMGAGHNNSSPYYSSSYGGYFVIDNCRFKRTSSSYMRMGISIDYGEDKRDNGVDFASNSNPVTGNRNDRYDNYGFIGNSTFDQMIFYSMAISRSKRLWIHNNDMRGGHWTLAQKESRFTSVVHLENNCVSFYITNNNIIDMGEYSGIELATFHSNDGNDHCKWIFIENNLFDGNILNVTDKMNVAIIGGPTTDCFVKNNSFNHNNTHPGGKIVAFWADNSTSPPSYASSNTKSRMTGNKVHGSSLNKNTQVALAQP